MAHCLVQCRNPGPVAVGGIDRGPLCEAQGKRTNATEQVGHRFRGTHRSQHIFGQHLFSLGGGLEEAADGQVDFRGAHGDAGLLAQQDHLLVERQPRHAQSIGQRHQFFGAYTLGRLADAHIDTGIGGGDADIAIANGGAECAGNVGRTPEFWHQDRAGIEVEQVMAPELHVAGARLAGVQRGAAAPGAMGDDEAFDLRADAGMAERGFHEAGLERLVALRIHMLQLAAATDSEMRAEGFGAGR